jgi:Nif-specific regulatory protein
VVRLTASQFSVGRDSSNHLCLHDRAVSRKHFSISETDAAFHLVDLDSHNGTFVNGIPVRRKLLGHGDTIRVGHCELVFLIGEDDSLISRMVQFRDEAPGDLLTTTSTNLLPSDSNFGTDVGRMARDLNALFKVASIINSIRDLETLQRRLLELICEVVPADSAAVVITRQADDDPGSSCTWSRKGSDSPLLEIRREIVQRALWERSPTISRPSPQSRNAESVLCVPLTAVESTIGVLYLIAHGAGKRFEEDHVNFLTSIAGIAAVTLENVLALEALRSENRRLQNALDLDGIIVGESNSMRKVQEFIARVAGGDSAILIRGESGTGKELVARAIHYNSQRACKPFVAINCAAIPEGGTVFLDEVGELSPPLQAKLLRVLQQREFERVGSTRSLKFDARVLTATNKDLEQAIKDREFRQDLYYRLNVVSMVVPPLRERPDDIPLLAIYFAAKYAEKCKRPLKGISPEARALLMAYSWPGNVRELENAMEHAMVLGLTDEILPDDLPAALLEVQPAENNAVQYHARVNQLKKQLIIDAVAQTNGNYTEAAKLLGLHPNYLHRLIRNLDLKGALNGSERWSAN